MNLFCFGLGYTASRFAYRARDHGHAVAGTKTNLDGSDARALSDARVKLAAFRGDARSTDTARLLAGVTHVLASIPPDLEGDPVLRHHHADLAALPSLEWVGYLSTVGVYGDRQGRWVDETAALRPTSERSLRRVAAERAWLEFARETGHRVEIFRLAGIYGPGRSMIEALRRGTAKRLVKPGQVFNRIHVDDIVTVLEVARMAPHHFDIYNVADDEPAPPQDVVAFAADLLGMPAPPELAFDKATLTPMARSFYGENKRVSNARLKSALGFAFAYPTYREGLTAIAAGR